MNFDHSKRLKGVLSTVCSLACDWPVLSHSEYWFHNHIHPLLVTSGLKTSRWPRWKQSSLETDELHDSNYVHLTVYVSARETGNRQKLQFLELPLGASSKSESITNNSNIKISNFNRRNKQVCSLVRFFYKEWIYRLTGFSPYVKFLQSEKSIRSTTRGKLHIILSLPTSKLLIPPVLPDLHQSTPLLPLTLTFSAKRLHCAASLTCFCAVNTF